MFSYWLCGANLASDFYIVVVDLGFVVVLYGLMLGTFLVELTVGGVVGHVVEYFCPRGRTSEARVLYLNSGTALL